MNKLHPLANMVSNDLFIPKLQRSNHWSSGLDRLFHVTFIRHDCLSMRAHKQRRCYRGFLGTSHLLPPTRSEITLQTPSNDATDSSPCWKLCNAVAASHNFSPCYVTFPLSHAVGFVASRFIQLLRCVPFLCATPRNFRNASWFFAKSLTFVTSRIFAAKRSFHLWPLLLTWFNFNPSMDK